VVVATFNEIAVGVDFGPGGDDALALARSLIAEGGRLTLVNVVRSDPHVFGGLGPAAFAQERARSLDLLDRERKLLELSDRQAGHRTSVRPGVRSIYAASVGRGLCFAAAKEKTDLLVVGTTRQGRLGRILLADDTAAVIRGAPCSVAVAPLVLVAGDRL
jgi:nucleotide-binding universal stress UspA family protein